MKIIYPTQYCASILLYALQSQGFDLILEQYENYQKRSFRNKLSCLSANGISSLSIPLKKGKNNQTNIRDVKISYDENWIRLHLTTLKSAYGRTAFYEHYIEGIQSVLEQEETFLYDLNTSLQNHIFKLLQIEDPITLSDEYSPKGYNLDLRNSEEYKSFAAKQTMERYPQVFEDKYGFIADLSILDLLFNKGPEAKRYLINIDIVI